MNDTADHPRRWASILLVCLLAVGLLVGVFVGERRKCPPLRDEVMLYVTFLPSAGAIYCDLPPALQREYDQARAQIEAKRRR